MINNPKQQSDGRKALDDLRAFGGGVSHADEHDEVGYRTCCYVPSYRDHSQDCDFNNALATLRQIVEAYDRKVEAHVHNIDNEKDTTQ